MIVARALEVLDAVAEVRDRGLADLGRDALPRRDRLLDGRVSDRVNADLEARLLGGEPSGGGDENGSLIHAVCEPKDPSRK